MAKYIVQHRRGTASQWASNGEIIPRAGELVIEIDEENSLHKLKIGDGEHKYSELAYLMAGDEIVTQVLAQAKPRIVTVELSLNWTKDTDDKYSQVINLPDITKHSRLDLQPNADMIAEFKQLGLGFTTENNGGIITVCSVGNMPLKTYTMQATIVEAECTTEDIPVVGIPVGAPAVQADWNQSDATKADYIKNKPNLTIDSQIDTESENPVQNKIISAALDQKLDTKAADKIIDNIKHEILDITANTLKNTVSGEIVRMDDVSPIQQWAKVFLDTDDESINLIDVGIKRYGKNLFNPALLYCTNFEDGIFETTGLSFCNALTPGETPDNSPEMIAFQSIAFNKPNTQYVFSFKAYASALSDRGICARVFFRYNDGTEDEGVLITTDGYSKEFEPYVLVSAKDKTVVSLEAEPRDFGSQPLFIRDVQLEVGDKATEYVPYINYATHKRDTPDEYYTTKVYTEVRVFNDPGSYSVRTDIPFVTIPFEEAGKYKLRLSKIGGGFAYVSEVFANCLTDRTQDIRFQVEDYSNAFCGATGGNTLPMDGSGGNPENTLFRQGDWIEYDIEILIAGEYEVGIRMGTATNTDQTLRIAIDETCLGANILYPCTTLFTDTPGVSLTCIYSQDTNYIQECIESLQKSVDSDLIPDYNQNDENKKDYIKNRPFYTESREITWDGNMTGRVSIDLSFMGEDYTNIYIVHVSDMILTTEQLLGHDITDRYNNGELGHLNRTTKIEESNIQSVLPGSISFGNGQVTVVYNAEELNNTLGTSDIVNGIYFFNNVSNCYIQSLSYSVIHKIDKKYLPDIPTRLSELTNDTNYQNLDQVNASIKTFIEDATLSGIKYYGDASVVPSPLEWFSIADYEDENSGIYITIEGLSEIWRSLEDDSKYDLVIPYENEDGKPIVYMIADNILNIDKLNSITLPNCIINIISHVDITNNVTIICSQGSYAEQFAIENRLNYVCTTINTSIFNDIMSNFENYMEKSILANGQKYYGNAGVHIPSPKEWFNFVVDNNTARLEGMSNLWNSLEDNSKYDIIIPYENEDGILVTCIGGWYLAGFQLTNVIIPNTITTIENGALIANNFKSIIIPDSVTSIGEQALDSTVRIICSKDSYAETYAKENGYKYAYDIVDVSTLEEYDSAITGLNYYEDATAIPSPIEWFTYSTNTENNTINITGMSNEWVDLEDESKKDIVVPYEIDGNRVTTIGDYSFYASMNDFYFNNVILPNTINNIGQSAFSGNNTLTFINIPNGITNIGDGAFSGCTNLTSINIPNGVTNIGFNAFFNCTSLTSINIPNSVISIADGAFSGCTSLIYINIPNSVTSIGFDAFYNCNNLTSINIPDSVTTISSEMCNRNITTLICSKGSYTEEFAKKYGYKYAYNVIKIDDNINPESENPLQNKVITNMYLELITSDSELAYSIDSCTENINTAIEKIGETETHIEEIDKKIDTELENMEIYVDDTLSLINGEKIGTVIEEINWENGALEVGGGTPTPNNNRARTSEYLECNDSTVLIVSENVQIIAFYYSTKSYAGYITRTDWLTGTINLADYAPEGTVYFKMSARYVTETSSSGVDLSGDNISLVVDNVKLKRYYEKIVVATLSDLDERVNKASKSNNHFYETVDFSEIVDNALTLNTNRVTYVSGTTELETLTISFDTTVELENIAQETVLILDLSNYAVVPTIVFDGNIKWINGEVPTIINGIVYMISFTHIRNTDGAIQYSLAVGGEFL